MTDYAKHPDIFIKRHVGPSDDDVISMLGELGFSSMSEFINNVIPDSIAFDSTLKVGDGVSEQEAIKILKGSIGLLYNDPKLLALLSQCYILIDNLEEANICHVFHLRRALTLNAIVAPGRHFAPVSPLQKQGWLGDLQRLRPMAWRIYEGFCEINKSNIKNV